HPGAGLLAGVWRKTKTIGPQDAARMQNGPIAYRDMVIKRDPGMQQAVITHHRIGPNDAARPQARAFPYACARLNDTARPYACPGADDGRGRMDGAVMYTGVELLQPVPVGPLRQQGVHPIGLAAYHGAKGATVRRQGIECRLCQDNRGGPGML